MATVVLAVLTGIYVAITRQIAVASREEVRLLAKAQDAERREARRALSSLAKRLSALVDALPFPHIQVTTIRQRAVLWTEDELRDLDDLARTVETADIDAASDAVEALRFIGAVVKDIKALEERQGWNPNSIQPQDWTTRISVARNALGRLQEAPSDRR